MRKENIVGDENWIIIITESSKQRLRWEMSEMKLFESLNERRMLSLME